MDENIWQVALTYSADLGEPDDQLVERLDAIATELEDLAASVGGGHQGLSVTLAIEAPSHIYAMDDADQRIQKAAAHVHLHVGHVEEAEARTWARAEAELEQPNYPDIVSAVEAADILGVSRQRVHQLHRENRDFPEPLYELRTGPLWVRAGIEKFAGEWERKPGRPRKPVI